MTRTLDAIAQMVETLFFSCCSWSLPPLGLLLAVLLCRLQTFERCYYSKAEVTKATCYCHLSRFGYEKNAVRRSSESENNV